MRSKNPKMKPVVSIFILIMMTFFCRPGLAGGAPIVRTDKNIYHPGEIIKVHFLNSPGIDSDWICIVPAGSPDTDGGDYKYMPRGSGQGSLIFNPRSPGKYEVRAYYNYRRNGYVVSGRYAFSVAGGSVGEEVVAQDMEQVADPGNPLEANLPPPIPFVEPPNVVVLPGTDVYAVPDVEAEIFFQGGWWWRPWGGHWYRSKYHDRGWAFHRDSPSWYRGIPHDWRHNYRNNIWGGRSWNPHHVNHGALNQHSRDGHWRNDHGLGRPDKPAPHGGGPGVGKPGVGPNKPTPHVGGPGGGKPGSGRPDGGPDKPTPPGSRPGVGKPGGGSDKPTPHGGGPGGGKPGSGPDKPTPPGSRPGVGKPGGGSDKPTPHGGGPGVGKPGSGSDKPTPHGGGPGVGKPGGGSDKPTPHGGGPGVGKPGSGRPGGDSDKPTPHGGGPGSGSNRGERK
jgi:hypothetical protein